MIVPPQTGAKRAQARGQAGSVPENLSLVKQGLGRGTAASARRTVKYADSPAGRQAHAVGAAGDLFSQLRDLISFSSSIYMF
jgi:hypothetical protein